MAAVATKCSWRGEKERGDWERRRPFLRRSFQPPREDRALVQAAAAALGRLISAKLSRSLTEEMASISSRWGSIYDAKAMKICIAVSARSGRTDRDTTRVCSLCCSLKYAAVKFLGWTVDQKFSKAVCISCRHFSQMGSTTSGNRSVEGELESSGLKQCFIWKHLWFWFSRESNSKTKCSLRAWNTVLKWKMKFCPSSCQCEEQMEMVCPL